jgi:hypothetical protein
MWQVWRTKEVHKRFCLENLKETECWEDLGIDRVIILSGTYGNRLEDADWFPVAQWWAVVFPLLFFTQRMFVVFTDF